mmetsp:Transcript_27913/g.86347  ORF Transcript_27913/g.86347 Transcript_27913/m.86347 type:complete len:281 (-) Transcript_27913:149-991(-)
MRRAEVAEPHPELVLRFARGAHEVVVVDARRELRHRAPVAFLGHQVVAERLAALRLEHAVADVRGRGGPLHPEALGPVDVLRPDVLVLRHRQRAERAVERAPELRALAHLSQDAAIVEPKPRHLAQVLEAPLVRQDQDFRAARRPPPVADRVLGLLQVAPPEFVGARQEAHRALVDEAPLRERRLLGRLEVRDPRLELVRVPRELGLVARALARVGQLRDLGRDLGRLDGQARRLVVRRERRRLGVVRVAAQELHGLHGLLGRARRRLPFRGQRGGLAHV